MSIVTQSSLDSSALADVEKICLSVLAREAREGLGLTGVLLPVFTNFIEDLTAASTVCLKALLIAEAENFPDSDGSKSSMKVLIGLPSSTVLLSIAT